MGTYYQNIECCFICRTEEELLAAFAHAEDCFDDVFTLKDFVRVGPSYVMMKMPMGMPYSVSDGVEGFFLELISAGFWGQYFLENEELGIDTNQRTQAPSGVTRILPPAPVQNSPGFASYFVPWEGKRMFSSGEKEVTVRVEQGKVDGTDYFTYVPTRGNDKRRFPLNFAFFRIAENSIYTVDLYYDQRENLQKGAFGDYFYLEEIFATDDPNLNQSAFIFSEENGFTYHKFQFRTQAELKINDQLFEDIILIRGQYIHGNCYKFQGPGKQDFEHYIEPQPDYYLYFKKDEGLVGYKWLLEDGSWEEFAQVPFVDQPDSETGTFDPFLVPDEPKEQDAPSMLDKEPPTSPPAPKKKGFWDRLFGGDQGKQD